MKKYLFIIVVLFVIGLTANAYAPLVPQVDESASQSSSSSSGSNDSSTVDLSDKSSDVCYSPSLDNQQNQGGPVEQGNN
ncbi:MAG: hypothetical protein HQL28_02820 [Candidatus Omnitrophica bacterium]|nr:hypothetical protein [Candidatus Omnitrophota bacterium]